MRKNYHHSIFVQYKKVIYLFSLYSMNKNNKRKEKKLKRKKLKGKKFVAGVLGAALLCVIHGATVENNFFEEGDDTNTFRAFNPTQLFLHLKK
jgi:hypothetical protein